MIEIGAWDTNGLLFQRNTDGKIYLGQTNVLRGVAWIPSLDTWYHLALVRQGQYTSFYQDGVLVTTFDFGTTQNLNGGTNGVRLGRGWTGTSHFLGYIDEFRISKGIARWTVDFTPPAEAYSAAGGTIKTSGSMSLMGIGT